MIEVAYDLYGSKTLSLDEARAVLESGLDVRFVPHESDFMGGEYYRYSERPPETLEIVRNSATDGTEGVSEPGFSDFAILLQVDRTSRGDQLRGLLANIEDFEFLRRRTGVLPNSD